jgi:hypothetical protein
MTSLGRKRSARCGVASTIHTSALSLSLSLSLSLPLSPSLPLSLSLPLCLAFSISLPGSLPRALSPRAKFPYRYVALALALALALVLLFAANHQLSMPPAKFTAASILTIPPAFCSFFTPFSQYFCYFCLYFAFMSASINDAKTNNVGGALGFLL